MRLVGILYKKRKNQPWQNRQFKILRDGFGCPFIFKQSICPSVDSLRQSELCSKGILSLHEFEHWGGTLAIIYVVGKNVKVYKLYSIYIHIYVHYTYSTLYTILIMIIDYFFAGTNLCVLTKNYSREKVFGTFSTTSAREKQFFFY